MKRKYKFVFMGALRNSIILSCVCNDISSTEAPGETVTTPKLRSHRWYANMSISQLSISYLQEASAATQETEESPRRRRIVVWGKLVVEVMAPSHLSASPRGCHLQRGGPWTTDRQEALWRVPIQGFIGVTHSQKSSQHVISWGGKKWETPLAMKNVILRGARQPLVGTLSHWLHLDAASDCAKLWLQSAAS